MSRRLFWFILGAITFSGLSAQTDVRARADALIKKKADCLAHNKRNVYYYIQIYNGKDLARAKAVLREFLLRYPNAKANITWENPEYKVWAGQYTTKFEAEQAWMTLKEEYPDALIVYPRKRH